MKTKVGIIGATGYAGVELIRLLSNHSKVEISSLCSVSFEGQSIADIYPSLANIIEDKLVNAEEVIEKSDVIFASIPHGHSQKFAKECIDKNKLFIDLGADFRLSNEKDYKEWYGLDYIYPELHEMAIYSIPELVNKNLKGQKLIANPGCYPTSVSLGLYPALKEKLIDKNSIIIDSKSGVTGAGRGLSQNTHFPDNNEAFSAYKICTHRHTPEIEEMLTKLYGDDIKVTFVPHLLPLNRGILSTIYCNLTKDISLDEIIAIYNEYYKDKKFVRVLAKGKENNVKYVKFSNYCNVAINKDERTNRLVIVSCIDNMVKGAAGQAIQNMNLCLGFDESEGLDIVPPAF